MSTRGYVYVLQSPSKAYKIGHTKNPNNRMRTFKVNLPFEIEYLYLIESLDCRALERQLHTLFRDRRIRGEFFALTADDLDFLGSLETQRKGLLDYE